MYNIILYIYICSTYIYIYIIIYIVCYICLFACALHVCRQCLLVSIHCIPHTHNISTTEMIYNDVMIYIVIHVFILFPEVDAYHLFSRWSCQASFFLGPGWHRWPWLSNRRSLDTRCAALRCGVTRSSRSP